MQKLLLPISITFLSFAILLIGALFILPHTLYKFAHQPSSIQSQVNSKYDENSNPDASTENIYHSARILGTTVEPTQSTEVYRTPPTLTPTWTGVPEGGYTSTPANNQNQGTSPKTNSPQWNGSADKEAYCRDIAEGVVAYSKQNPPQVDQSNLPPELRVSPDWNAWWEGSYRDCMNMIKRY